MSYENKLLQMKSLLKKAPQNRVESKPTFKKPTQPTYIKEWSKEGLEIVENDYGVVLKKTINYPIDYQHGSIKFNEYYKAIQLWSEAEEEHPYSISEHDQVVFFDTETTGLKGTGTLIFLIGFLTVTQHNVQLTQYLLSDPGNEAAFLYETKLWEKSHTLVSYNGKSFDWPQLETRWTMNRDKIPPLKEQRHVDLLMGSRRIWKDELDRFKLTKIEEEKLDFHRIEDIPGHLAPIIYLDAVKSGRPELLMKVLLHNEWDILSLLTLFIRTSELLLLNENNETATTNTNIGKWYRDLKFNDKSKYLFEQVIHTFKEDTSNAFFFLGFQLKKEKLIEEALESFLQSLVGLDERRKLQAYVEIAKLYEHKKKDFNKAMHATQQAIEIVMQSNIFQKQTKLNFLSKLEKRRDRLEMKEIK